MTDEKQGRQSWADSAIIDEMLDSVRTIAVIGLSDKPHRASNGVARTLIEHGYRIVGVNPTIKEALGSICYPTLEDIPEPVDMVDVFRRPDEIGGIITEVIRLKIPYVWLQEGVVNYDAARRAHDAGIKVVMDKCIAKEIFSRI